MKMNTCDTKELNHFKSYCSTWWDESGPFQVLHAINPLRLAFIKEKIGVHFKRPETSLNPFNGLRILDVGCGGGVLCEPLARLGADVTGIDPLYENIEVAKAHAEAMGLDITYLPFAIEDSFFDGPQFDVIIASEIIEHVANPDGFLTTCLKHLSPQGGIIITTFNKTLKSYLLGIVAAEYIMKWAPRGTHTWEKFITPQNLSQKLSSHGLNNQEFQGLGFFPLAREWRLSSSKDVNYFFWATYK